MLEPEYTNWLKQNPKPQQPYVFRTDEERREFDRRLDAWLIERLQFEGFAEWRRHNPEPDLHALIRKFGSYSKIPGEAWSLFDQEMEQWKQLYRLRNSTMRQLARMR